MLFSSRISRRVQLSPRQAPSKSWWRRRGGSRRWRRRERRRCTHPQHDHPVSSIMTLAIGDMSLLQAIDHFLRRWKRSYDSRRKIVILVIGVLFILYFAPWKLRSLWSATPHITSDEISTLEKQLLPFLREEEQFSTFISRSWISDTNAASSHDLDHVVRQHVTPFVGNGKFGLDLDADAAFRVRGRRGLEQELPFYPMVRLDAGQSISHSATVIRFVNGVVHKFVSFPYVGSTVTISETIYAHRLLSSLLVHEVSVYNPSEVQLILSVSRNGWRGKSPLKTETVRVAGNVQYILSEGEVRAIEGSLVSGFVVAAPLLSDSVQVPPKQRRAFVFRTFVNYTKPMPQTRIASAVTDMKNSIRETVSKANELASPSLLRFHTDIWNNIWQSGFGISFSRADGALNGDIINATMYFILSHTPTFASNVNFLSNSEVDDPRTNFLLNHPDRCYSGNPTLQAPNLWSSLRSFTEMQKMVTRWLLTLEKNGCRNLMSAGAEGMMQAVILSFAGMQFHQSHIEMGIHPKELHRDYFLRRLRYSNHTSLNVTMTVGEDNKASIYVVLDKNTGGQDFFACDAGCLDPPVVLSSSWKQLPVKITEPLTAILYITPDLTHVRELKQAIHVKEVAIAPPHEHQLIAMHRHGHRLGGLPTLFWAAIIILIVIFHLFLVKLIFNEYCGSGSGLAAVSAGYERMRRAV